MAAVSLRQLAQAVGAIDARTVEMDRKLDAIDARAVEMDRKLDAVDARTAQMDRKLDDVKEALRALSSMTARMPDGRTLINVVGTILNEVQN